MYLTFYTGTAFYVLAALAALLYLRNANARFIAVSSYLLIAGMLLLIGTFAFRWAIYGHLPLTTMTDSINLLAVLTAPAILLATRKTKEADRPFTSSFILHPSSFHIGMPALLCFYLPPLAVICLINAAVAHRFLCIEPRALSNLLLSVHVGLAVLAYALFFLASMTSAAYLFQARHLKRHQTSELFRRLPSLAELDAALFGLIRYGYPVFIATLLLGLIWAFIDRNLLNSYWWLSPKVVLSYAMAAFYAATFHLRRIGRLRGPKLAQLVFAGFFLLIVSYMALSILNLRGYHFWSSGP